MKQLYNISIEITLTSPWLVYGSDPGRFGLDATMMRDHNGRFILPGSLLQGRLRHAWTEMQKDFGLDMPEPKDWFGREGNDAEGRGRVWVNDLVMEEIATEDAFSTRVKIDAETGAASQGMLLMIEQICPPGAEVSFKGTWRAWLDNKEKDALSAAIQAGLNWQTQLGAQRSVGFGKVIKVVVVCESVKEYGLSTVSAERLRLALNFDSPICVGSRSRRGNVFISSDIISGGTIKGALASQLRQKHGQWVAKLKETSKLAEHFDELRISHAFPSNDDTRPAALPLSLAAVGDTIKDLADVNTPQLIEGKAPAFCHDWKGKHWGAAVAQQRWGKTRSHLRVRTAIDAETRTAKESQLFAYECRVAEEGTRWLADIDLSAIPEGDREKVSAEIAALLQCGLGPIGKTDAWANVQLSSDVTKTWDEAEISTGQIILQLNTPALLIASAQVANKDNPDLQDIYSSIFTELSDSSLQLSHFYASHDMAGGDYLAKRRQAAEDFNYRPYVLTEAGSVFVFTVNDQEAAKTALASWQRNGLPLPEAVCDESGNNWQRNPYLPQNGYGEIAVNLQHGFKRRTSSQLIPCFGSEQP